MTGRHVTAAELELYVLGALEGARGADFETHCAECEACAAALVTEARLEVAFEQVARRPRRAIAPRPVRVAAYGAAGLLAVAAAVLLWFGHSPAATATAAASDGTVGTFHHAAGDGAILDAFNDALDGG